MDLFLILGMEWFHCMFSWRVSGSIFVFGWSDRHITV